MVQDAVGQSARPVPISLRISVTDRCRFRCLYCTPAGGVGRFAVAEILRYKEILRFVRLMMARFGLEKVHITGGEPLERRGITGFVRMLAAEGIEDLAMTTNGQQLGELAADLKQAGLRRINVSLYSLRPLTFRELTGGGDLGRTLEGIDAARSAGLAPVKCNVTVLRGINDQEVADLAQWGIERRVQVRFIELMPFGPAAKRHRDWFVRSEEMVERLRSRFQMQPLPYRQGSSSRDIRITDTAGNAGVIGLISPYTQPFCAGCRRLRLTANGELVGCLARNSRARVQPLLRADGPFDEAAVLANVSAVMRQKRTRRAFSRRQSMVKTGG